MLELLRVVDLTQPLDAGTVMWPGAPAPVAETILTVAHDGFYNRKVTFVEHTGTHFDAPCHMVEGQASVEEIPADRLVRPLVVIDIAAEIDGDPDGVLTLEHVRAFEARHGRIPDGAAVFIRTGWEEFNRDPARYANAPGSFASLASVRRRRGSSSRSARRPASGPTRSVSIPASRPTSSSTARSAIPGDSGTSRTS